MGSISFDTALNSMASYIGNLILPVCAGLVLCVGLYQLAHRAKAGERYITAAGACLLASGMIRLVESFSTQQTGQDQFYFALLGLTNWVGNVIMPMYCVVNLIRAILSVSKASFELTSVSGNTQRHVLVAIGCLGVSMTLRLLEWFVSTGAGGIH